MTELRGIDIIAERAGVTVAQAEAVLKAMRHPTEQQCNAADDKPGPPQFWSENIPTDVIHEWTDYGWSGLTPLEFAFAKYAHSWRIMCDTLLLPADHYSLFEHPKGDFR